MKVEEMVLRSEIRQMLNEAGFNRDTIKQLVKDSINDIIKGQVNQVLMERREQNLSEVVEKYLNDHMYSIIRNSTESAIKEKMRWYDFSVHVDVTEKEENKCK